MCRQDAATTGLSERAPPQKASLSLEQSAQRRGWDDIGNDIATSRDEGATPRASAGCDGGEGQRADVQQQQQQQTYVEHQLPCEYVQVWCWPVPGAAQLAWPQQHQHQLHQCQDYGQRYDQRQQRQHQPQPWLRHQRHHQHHPQQRGRPAASTGAGAASRGRGRGRGHERLEPAPTPELDAWCDELSAALDDPEARSSAASAIRGQVLSLAKHPKGTRLVQKVLETGDAEAVDAVLAELSGRALEMMDCKHANYVVKHALENRAGRIPSGWLRALIGEFQGQADFVARHQYGYRFFIRIVMYHSGREGCAALVEELLSGAEGSGTLGALLVHKCAHHVLEAILEHMGDEQRRRIVRAMWQNLPSTARHLYGSFVVQAALLYCSDADVGDICAALTACVTDVASTWSGCKLYQELCTHHRTCLMARAALAERANELRQRPEGRKLVHQVAEDAAEDP